MEIPTTEARTPLTSRQRRALTFVVLMGVVSLLADMVYEGGRSISGPYLALLGASGTIVGLMAGAGELIAYGLRLVFGYLSDRTRSYWAFTIAGYTLTALAVPALALAGSWQLAVLLLTLERVSAAVATMVPAERRGTAYGLFNSFYGLAWFLGSATLGLLYDMALPALIAVSVGLQLLAVALLLLMPRASATP